jgi:hypothetical protein
LLTWPKTQLLAIQRNVRGVLDNACDPTGRTLGLLSCHRSVSGLLPAVPALSFAKLRSDKKQTKHPSSGFRAGSLQSIRRIFGDRACVRCRQFQPSQAQELRRPRPLFADRAQEGDK